MKVENTTNTGPNQQHSWKITEAKSYGYNLFINTATDTSNCKLSYIHGAGVLINLSNEDKKEVLDTLLRNLKGCIIINTIYKQVAEFIRKTYPTYYYQEVPIGYGTGYQYHICIKNTITVNGSCREPQPPTPIVDKQGIKTKLLTVLKTKRRKTDYVDEFINSL